METSTETHHEFLIHYSCDDGSVKCHTLETDDLSLLESHLFHFCATYKVLNVEKQEVEVMRRVIKKTAQSVPLSPSWDHKFTRIHVPNQATRYISSKSSDLANKTYEQLRETYGNEVELEPLVAIYLSRSLSDHGEYLSRTIVDKWGSTCRLFLTDHKLRTKEKTPSTSALSIIIMQTQGNDREDFMQHIKRLTEPIISKSSETCLIVVSNHEKETLKAMESTNRIWKYFKTTHLRFFTCGWYASTDVEGACLYNIIETYRRANANVHYLCPNCI